MLSYAVPAFFVLIFAEFLLARRQKKEVYRLEDSACSIGCGILQVSLNALIAALFTFALFPWIQSNWGLFNESLSESSWWVWALLFLSVDFGYYVFHFLAHKIPVVWASHAVHHSSEYFNLTTALRQGPVQSLFSWPIYLPLPFLGFSPEMIITMRSINTIGQFWFHTKTINKLGPLEWFLNTPSHHRVHHGSDHKYLDKNFAGILIIWDRLFGTFQREEEEPTYGVLRPVSSFNPIIVSLRPWKELWWKGTHTVLFAHSRFSGKNIYFALECVTLVACAFMLILFKEQMDLWEVLLLGCGIVFLTFLSGIHLDRGIYSRKIELVRLGILTVCAAIFFS